LDSPLGKDGRLQVVRYEDLKRDAEAALAKILIFLGVEREDQAIRTAVHNNTLDAMRQKEDRSRLPEAREGFRFVNEGSSGGWQQKLNAEQVHRIEQGIGNVLTTLGYAASTPD
jgi:hypothetical protein